MGLIRALFLSDTHLGFDLPLRPANPDRKESRRRRGPDFFRNFETALKPALDGECDLVIHGGDLLYRSRVAPELVRLAFEPIRAVADRGISVYVVPGNHERSEIPYPLLAQHENIFIFDRPRTFVWSEPRQNGLRIALAGFPNCRQNVRDQFTTLLCATNWRSVTANTRFLCIHQAVEGARVEGFTFRDSSDVIQAYDLPHDITAILSGHIHRAQAMTHDAAGILLPAPVLYPGSIERTSFAEKSEPKGYLTLAIQASGERKGDLLGWRFHRLRTRPMKEIRLRASAVGDRRFHSWLRHRLTELTPEAVVRLRVEGEPSPIGWEQLRVSALRELAPPEMDISVSVPSLRKRRAPSR